VFFDDILSHPAIEIEKIITFSGIELPSRDKVLMCGETLRKMVLARYNFTVADYKNIFPQDMSILQSGLNALEEELTGTKMLTMYVKYILVCLFFQISLIFY
jgi:hypothetical protein